MRPEAAGVGLPDRMNGMKSPECSDTMKITILGPAHPYRGGLASIMEIMARTFQRRGDEVDIKTFTLQYPSLLFPGESQTVATPPPADLRICRCVNTMNPLNWVRVQGSTKYIPRETYSMTISFDTNEEMADELREIVMKEIEEIAANGPKSEDIEKHREFMLKSWKNSLEQNGAWMNYIQIKYGSGLNYIADHEQAIRDLTNADVQALAKKILADGNLVKVVMRPSK